MMKPFRERNPVPIGIAGVIFLALFGVLAFQAQNLPFFNGGGKIYRANFTESANLVKTNAVRVAGVKVGTVTSVGLEDDHVVIKFRVRDGISLGSQTKASIRIATVVGQEYLALDSEGSGKLDPKTAIPVSRTTPPFDVIPAFQDLATTVNKIDTTQLQKALNTLSADFSDTAPNVKQALTGLSRLSTTIASRDEQLQTLLAHAKGVTGVLAGRDKELQQLLVSTDQVLQVLNARHEVISQLLQNTSALATQLTGLVVDNRSALNPALTHLKTVIDTLNANEASIYRTLQLAGPFVRVFSNTIGNGKWFDTYVANLGPFAAQVQLPPSLLGGSAGITGLLGGK
jgi:phospholipid/cholesterol/gamma-HCH transport system substrate-binding protein